MKALRTVADLQAEVLRWKRAGEVVGVVPTMGALHDGHLSLVAAAARECQRIIVTIFVNPRQFNNPEDLTKYPRTEEADLALLGRTRTDLVFAPPPEEVYPAGFVTNVRVTGLAERLEGLHRPGHFDGVATVVTKLLGMTLADRAYFGEKDWQQLQVVKRLVTDLNLAATVVGCPTIREPDGLARSSRNVRLSPEAREVAGALPRVMRAVADGIRKGVEVPHALAVGRQDLLNAGFEQVEYLDLCSAATLEWVDQFTRPARLLAAVWVGGVRLIDNIAVG